MTHPKRPRDPNQLVKSVVDVGQGRRSERVPVRTIAKINQAVFLGAIFANRPMLRP
jgi:hypothetical protein